MDLHKHVFKYDRERDVIICAERGTTYCWMTMLKLLKLRDIFFEEYSGKGVEFTNTLAKSTEIRRGVKIGKGNIIGAGCYSGTFTEICNNNPISYSGNIGRYNLIGDCNLSKPGICTSGSVIKRKTLI